MSPACVSLLTDFGLHDTYVGVMHGVLARLAPEARVIDLSHDVPPQDVRTAAFFWEQALPYFPPGVVHLAVVDPGVGTARAILLARRPEGVLIAPDNGLLAPFAADAELFRFEAWERALPDRATTFDGRDVFSPIAACVAQGVPLEALGSPIAQEAIAPLARAQPRDLGGGTWEGEVIHVDRFGNLITNLPSSLPVASLTVGGATIEGPAAAGYGEREPGATMVIAGSSRRLEVSVNRGSAARALAVHRGATVLLCVTPRQSHP